MALWPFNKSRRSMPSPIFPGSVMAAPYFSTAELQKNPTVIACINAIANPVSILPLNLYFKNPKDNTRQKAGWHPLYSLLRVKPNSSDSPTLFMSRLIRHLLQSGNAYIFKNFAGSQLVSIQLLNPEAVKRDVRNWPNIVYRYNGIDYTDEQILHIPNLITDDAGNGIAPADLARAAILLGTMFDQYSLNGFSSGLNTKLLLDIAEMTKDVKNEEEASKMASTVAEYVRRNYSGADNAGKPLVLFSGIKATELKNQSSNRDAELLDSRKWQEAEICKIFGVPQFLIGNYEIKYGGLEQAMTVFLNFNLSPYLRHIEQRLNTLLSSYEQGAYYFEFDFNVLLRSDEKSRAEYYTKLFMMGAISPAGICAKENMEAPTEAGETRFVPAQLMPLTQENMDAYMASAKLKAESLIGGTEPADPARAAGDDKL